MTELLIRLKDSAVEEQFDYIRTRIRICRSAALNFFMIALSLVAFIALKSQFEDRAAVIIMSLILGGFLFLVAFYSWRILTKSYYTKLAKRYRHIEAA